MTFDGWSKVNRPQGTYKGTVLPPFSFLNRIWKGKVFEGYTVTNTIFGRQMVTGRVHVEDDVVRIYYASGLVDTLTPIWIGHFQTDVWSGTMPLFGTTVRFILEKV